MKLKYVIFFVLNFALLAGCAYSKSFNFNSKEPQWSFYGEGLGSYVSNMGRSQDQTSLWLSTDWGESETAYFTWKDLTPGFYKIITYVRAQDVQKGSEGTSFWNFYDGGFGTQSPFMDLSGSFEWRKVEYTVNVKANELTVWFRLKSPGQAWVDDFYIEKVEIGNEKVSIEPAVSLNLNTKSLKVTAAKKAERKKLYNFEASETGHPFSLKNKAGEFSPQKFYNFKIDKMPLKDWTPYDRIEMDVFNPNETYADFTVTLADDKTKDYWSQVNHKQNLAPGWNKLNLSLTQFVGERGSHRYQRSINLAKLQKFFIVIDPDSKLNFISKSFLIDNIYLSSNPMPVIPEGVRAFDFTSQKAQDSGNLTRVTTQTNYNDQRGFGFVEPKYWRVEDSQYASEAFRYTIGIIEGHFRLKLPNGKYHMNLVIDKLGYWDVPFWSDRMVYANGSPIFKESRSTGVEFLNDLLRFQNVFPDVDDHPYDLYLSKVFKSINKTVDVTNGFLDLEFKGDQTGVSLNSLILWDGAHEAQGQAYKTAFEKRNKDEFDWMTHSIQKKTKDTNQKLSLAVIEPDLFLSPVNLKKASNDHLEFSGGVGDNPYQMVQINAGNKDEKVSWSVGDLKNEKGVKLDSKNILFSDLIFQYISPDINHETYLVSGKYLKPLTEQFAMIKKAHNKYLWLQIKINDKTPSGIFKGEVVFHHGTETSQIPISVTVLSYTLPKIEFPVGFLGLDPLPYTYFQGVGYSELRKKYRYLVLDTLGEAGFTTFTGLPEKIEDLDELFRQTSKWGIQTVYSYGGQFPQTYLDLGKKPGDMSEDAFYNKSTSELKDLFGRKNWPKIVHIFSDEAEGYSDKLASDIKLGQQLKKHFPFMSLGGFGSFTSSDSIKLNSLFDYGFYSSLSKGNISKLRELNQRWGFYNASAGNMDDPRFSFGLGLYLSRLNGLSQYLEWHSSAVNNYPYYDFDGRESDVVMFYPTSDGKLYHALRFELAVEGLHAYKKLKLLEDAIINNQGSREATSNAKKWIDGLRKENYFYSSSTFITNKNVNFREFENKLDEHLKNIFLKK